MKTIALSSLIGAALLAGCASGPPPRTDFPPGARAPSAAEAAGLLRGKSFNLTNPNGSSIRVDHAADASGGVAIYFSGRSDSGTWRTEDGRVCSELKTVPSACNDMRLAGKDIYIKRDNGQVVQLVPR